MKKLKLYIVLFSLCVSLISGCGTIRGGILYTIYPIGFVLDRIGGPYVTKETIQDDVMIQSASAKENLKELLEKYSVFFHVGTVEPYLTVHMDEIKESQIKEVDLSFLNTIYHFKQYKPILIDGERRFIEGPYYEGSAFSNMDIDELDLYLWLDPIVMLSMSKTIVMELERIYPDQREFFQNNLKQLEEDLIYLDAQYQNLSLSLIQNQEEIKFVSVSSSFGNWQKTYGFEVYPLVLSKYGVLPTDEQKKIMKTKILNEGVQYIVYEPNMSEEMVELFNEFEEELSLRRVELNNLSSLSEADRNEGKDYVSIMYENLSVLDTMRTKIDTTRYIEEVDEDE